MFAINGDNVTFNCTSVAANVTIEWLFNESSALPSNVAQSMVSPTESLLSITGAGQENIGTYTCVVTSNDGSLSDEDTACVVDVTGKV